LKRRVHTYSGFNSECFIRFLNNIDLFIENIHNVHVAATFLYRSIGCVEELALYATGDYQHEIQAITYDIGITGEKLLMKVAIDNNISFRPTYLNRLAN
jgi:hypothetical protein